MKVETIWGDVMRQNYSKLSPFFSRQASKINKKFKIALALLLFLPFVKYNTVSDSTLFLKVHKRNFLRNSSSHFF